MQPAPSCPAPTRWWWWASGLLLRWQLRLGAYSVRLPSTPSPPPTLPQLCCSLRLPNSPQTHLWEGFLLCGNFSSFMTPSPGWSPSLNLLSLFLSFMFCPTSFQRGQAAFLGAWCLPPAFRSCFVEVTQHSNDLLMNLWVKNWSPCPVPPLPGDRLLSDFLTQVQNGL